MAEPISPLQVIKQKELDLRHRLEEIRQQAEARLQSARTEARGIVTQADRAGRTEAETCYQQGVAEANQEAEAILAAAQEQAEIFRHRAAVHLDNAAGRIVELVLPPQNP